MTASKRAGRLTQRQGNAARVHVAQPRAPSPLPLPRARTYSLSQGRSRCPSGCWSCGPAAHTCAWPACAPPVRATLQAESATRSGGGAGRMGAPQHGVVLERLALDVGRAVLQRGQLLAEAAEGGLE